MKRLIGYTVLCFCWMSSYAQEIIPTSDNKIAWTSYISYDFALHTTAKGINYFNSLGAPIQQQAWDKLTGRVWGTELRFDNFNRPALQSLSAPLRDYVDPLINGFVFNGDFITTTNDMPMELHHYDDATTLLDPPAVGSSANTLGRYYSEDNGYDLYQDITPYPYTRKVYSNLSPGNTRAVFGGKKVTINGTPQWLQTYTFSMAIEKPSNIVDMAFYEKFSGKEVLKTVSRDVNGEDWVMFADTDGNILGAARSGYLCDEENQIPGRDPCSRMSVYSEILDNGYVDIHIPEYCSGITISNANNSVIKVYNLITEQEIFPPFDNLKSGFYRIEDTKNYYGENFSPPINATPVKVEYKVNYYDLTSNEYDKAGRLKKNTQAIDLESTYTYNSWSHLAESTSADTGAAQFKYRDDGQIRFSQNAEQAKVNSFSYTNYDLLGRPIESGVYTGTTILFVNLNAMDTPDLLPVGGRSEQVFSVYDIPDSQLITVLQDCELPTPDYKQTFLSGNVSYTYTMNGDDATRKKTWYSYDVFGRLRFMIQQVPDMSCPKILEYEYNPINGQVVKVIYQKHGNDQFVHKYEYNDVGQLINVETSTDDVTFTQQAHYIYNESGALKRTELATDLQGIDYTYNLSGQLKAINHPSLLASDDPGNDGGSGTHANFASDFFGMAIDYFDGDYSRNSTPSPITTSPSGKNQYNGNIKAIRWNTEVPSATQNAYTYEYNKDSWITDAAFGIAGSNYTIDPNPNGDYKEGKITYDPNGNIQRLLRNGYTDPNGGNKMDNFLYKYRGNRLKYVKDVGDNADPNRYSDIKDQENPIASGNGSYVPDNYLYNDLGQMVFNLQDKVGYQYTSSGLVSKITTTTPIATGDFVFLEKFDYDHTVSANSEVYRWTGQPHLTGATGIQDDGCTDIVNYTYGLGIEFLETGTAQTKQTVMPNTYTEIDLDVLVDKRLYNSQLYDPSETALNITLHEQEQLALNPVVTVTLKKPDGTVIDSQTVTESGDPTESYCGHLFKRHVHFQYTTESEELVLIEINRTNGLGSTTVDGRMKQRVLIDNLQIKAATQVKVTFTYNERGQRVRKQSFHPGMTETTYYVRDLSGSTMAVYSRTIKGDSGSPKDAAGLVENAVYGLGRIGIFKRQDAYTLYELTDHLGNVRGIIMKTGSGIWALKGKTDFYPFGMVMPNRQITENNYRYAFQGQEKDGETGMEAFELRLWEGRLGRWLTVDPMAQYASPYLGMGNNPINLVDPTGGSTGDPPTGFFAWVNGLFTAEPIELDEVTVYSKGSSSNSLLSTLIAGVLTAEGAGFSIGLSSSFAAATVGVFAPIILAGSDSHSSHVEDWYFEKFATEGAYAPSMPWAESSPAIISDIEDRNNSSGYYLHYTTIQGAYEINKTKVLIPNRSNKVYLTSALMTPAEAAEILFINQDSHANRGNAVVIMKLHPYQAAGLESNPSDIFELYHTGTLRPETIIYSGPNPFGGKKR